MGRLDQAKARILKSSQVCHMHGNVLSTWPFSAAFPDTTVESWIKAEQRGLKQVLITDTNGTTDDLFILHRSAGPLEKFNK